VAQRAYGAALQRQRRHKYPEFRGRYARIADPLPTTGDSDDYAIFVAALRTWIGQHGLAAMAWSFTA